MIFFPPFFDSFVSTQVQIFCMSEKNLCFCHFSLLQSRVHCFHYLIPLTKQGNYAIVANMESMDYDPLVVKLNKDISAIEEAMGAALQQHKFQYIFEGLERPCFVAPCCSGSLGFHPLRFPLTRTGTSHLLYSNKRSAVLQEDQRIRH